MTLLEARHITKRFGPVTALDHIDLTIPPGSRTAIVGPSGCGKTTLLRLIAGFERADEGSIMLDGEIIAHDAYHTPPHLRGVGIVAQEGSLFPHLSIGDNIGFGLSSNISDRQARIAELMEMVGLGQSMLSRMPDQLSGGQQQRVALARAMARKPRLMLLDEPFSALDTALRAATRKAVSQVLASAGIAVLLVTHDRNEALAFADQIAVMRSGKFVQTGTPQEIYSRPVDAQTAAFLGDAILLSAHIHGGEADCPLGRVPVDDAGYSGSGTIMLRPEKILVSRTGEGVGAVVTGITFCGPTSEVELSLGGNYVVTLEIPNREDLHRGDEVAVAVLDKAHVFQALEP